MMDESLRETLAGVEIPTLGHFLEDGFCSPRIRPQTPVERMCGTAHTVDLAVPDAIAVNRALLAAHPGDVLVIRVASGRHAPVGAVTVAAALAQGIVGIVVDGPVTDLSALQASGLPVYAEGTTALTTKLLDSAEATVGSPVQIGGVPVSEGDVVLGDENGLLIVPRDTLTPQLIAQAAQSDQAEPALIARIAAGEPLDTLLKLSAPSLSPHSEPAPPARPAPKDPLP